VNPLNLAIGPSVECAHEREVLEALSADATLESWSGDLRAHAGACPICRDIVAVALPLLQEHRASIEDAHPPSSGIVWWRAQMHARQEAARAATRPITVVQAAGAVAGAAAFMTLLSITAPVLTGWFGGLGLLSDLREALRVPQGELSSLVPSTGSGLLLAAACFVCLLLGPLAVYFAFDE
jgi:hypothetical protein